MPSVSEAQIKRLSANSNTVKTIARMQEQIYPCGMQDDLKTIREILESSDLSRGMYRAGKLIGYALVQRAEKEGTVYLFDFAVLPQFQRRGLGTRLAAAILRETNRRKLRIAMHVRSSSYPLFGNRQRMRRMGYDVAKDRFLADWYFGEYGVHEDAHELLMEPTNNLSLAGGRKAQKRR